MNSAPFPPKTFVQQVKDFLGFPLRASLAHSPIIRRLGLSTLQDERYAAIWPHLQGKVLDIGSGENRLIELYKNGVGVDVYDWGGGTVVVADAAKLPFDNATFDTVTFVACLNHIPNRREALRESLRVLKPAGRAVLTMINPIIGYLAHIQHEESHIRGMEEGELKGIWPAQMIRMIQESGYRLEAKIPFLYGLNDVYVARKPG